MIKFSNFFMNDLIKEALQIDEGVDRNIIVRKSTFIGNISGLGSKQADYEWVVGKNIYYLFSEEIGKDCYGFKFTNEHLETKNLKGSGGPATSIFSGAILAIKEFIDTHKVIFFRIDCLKSEIRRISIYRSAVSIIADETNFDYMDEIEDKEFIQFIFRFKG